MPNDELIDFRGIQHFKTLTTFTAVMGNTRKSVDARIEELMAYYSSNQAADPVGEVVGEDLSSSDCSYCPGDPLWQHPNKYRVPKGYRPTFYPIPGTKSIALIEVHSGSLGHSAYEMGHQSVLATDETYLPMIVDEWPKPTMAVDVQSLWTQHMKGAEVDQKKVFYTISPGETCLVQGLRWITVGGWPMLTGYKKVTLCKWKKNPTCDDSFLEFVHETLAPLLGSSDPQCRSDLEDLAAQLVPGSPSAR